MSQKRVHVYQSWLSPSCESHALSPASDMSVLSHPAMLNCSCYFSSQLGFSNRREAVSRPSREMHKENVLARTKTVFKLLYTNPLLGAKTVTLIHLAKIHQMFVFLVGKTAVRTIRTCQSPFPFYFNTSSPPVG